MTKQEQQTLRQTINQHKFLEVVEDFTNRNGLAVFDAREDEMVLVQNAESLADLVEHGAAWHLGHYGPGTG
jgi:hypothetical protein